jgi:hypothetical protein
MLSSRKEDFAMKQQTVLGSKRASPGVCKNPRDAQRATSKRAMREKRRSQVDDRSRQKFLALVIGSEGEDAQSKFAL